MPYRKKQQVSERVQFVLFISNLLFCKNGSEMQTESALQTPLGMESALTSPPRLFSLQRLSFAARGLTEKLSLQLRFIHLNASMTFVRWAKFASSLPVRGFCALKSHRTRGYRLEAFSETNESEFTVALLRTFSICFHQQNPLTTYLFTSTSIQPFSIYFHCAKHKRISYPTSDKNANIHNSSFWHFKDYEYEL